VEHVVKPLIAEASVVKVPLLASVYKVRPSHNRITEHMLPRDAGFALQSKPKYMHKPQSDTAASYPQRLKTESLRQVLPKEHSRGSATQSQS